MDAYGVEFQFSQTDRSALGSEDARRLLQALDAVATAADELIDEITRDGGAVIATADQAGALLGAIAAIDQSVDRDGSADLKRLKFVAAGRRY